MHFKTIQEAIAFHGPTRWFRYVGSGPQTIHIQGNDIALCGLEDRPLDHHTVSIVWVLMTDTPCSDLVQNIPASSFCKHCVKEVVEMSIRKDTYARA
jgi:hypothetical protein